MSLLDFTDFLSTGARVAFGSDEAEVRSVAVASGLALVRTDVDPSYDAFVLSANGVDFVFEDAELMSLRFEADRTGPLDVLGTSIDQGTTLEEFTHALDQADIGWSSGLLATGEPIVTTTAWVFCYFATEEPHCFVKAVSTVP
ncbi:hypothetical protein [Streptomyces sp. NPDC093149]|uniref:hypothetical protein n=1 Tax=Streptomyces sp. NPDC093149 TaxID=3366031 RepID=UPI00381E72E3